MKKIFGYESDGQLGEFDERTHGYPQSSFGRIETALRRRGIEPRQAVRDNQLLPLANIGDYRYSGGGFIVVVPDDFEEVPSD
jgi:hypothetical protein